MTDTTTQIPTRAIDDMRDVLDRDLRHTCPPDWPATGGRNPNPPSPAHPESPL